MVWGATCKSMQIVEVNPPQLAVQMEKYELSYVSIQNLWNKHVVFLLNYEQDQGSIPCVSTKQNKLRIRQLNLSLFFFKSKNMYKIIISLILISILDNTIVLLTTNFIKNEIDSEKIELISLFSNKVSKKKLVYFEILSQDIEYPDIVFAQAMLESGYMSSTIYLENNNLFGMRFPGRRPTVALYSNKGYSVYDCWTKSIEDYKLFQDFLFRKKKKTRDEYFNYLGRLYAEDSSYVFFVKKIINENKHIFLNDNKNIYIKYNEYKQYAPNFCEIFKPKNIV